MMIQELSCVGAVEPQRAAESDRLHFVACTAKLQSSARRISDSVLCSRPEASPGGSWDGRERERERGERELLRVCGGQLLRSSERHRITGSTKDLPHTLPIAQRAKTPRMPWTHVTLFCCTRLIHDESESGIPRGVPARCEGKASNGSSELRHARAMRARHRCGSNAGDHGDGYPYCSYCCCWTCASASAAWWLYPKTPGVFTAIAGTSVGGHEDRRLFPRWQPRW